MKTLWNFILRMFGLKKKEAKQKDASIYPMF
jgi:hypothetical protein